mgnify:FL=1
MKYLTDYTKEPLTNLLDKHQAFFAFSNEQFFEQATRAIHYTRIRDMSGLIIPKIKAKSFLTDYSKMVKGCIKQDIKENSIDGIIERELSNHECYYTGDYSDLYILEGYNISSEDIERVYLNTYKQHQEV